MELLEVWNSIDGPIYAVRDNQGRYLGNVYPESDGMGGAVWFAQNSSHTRTSTWEDDFETAEDAAMWCAVQSPYRAVLEVA